MTHDRWAHIPTLGDHYSPLTGSAVVTVIREMTRAHATLGGVSRVLVATETWAGFDDGLREEVAFSRATPPLQWEKAVDCAAGLWSDRRWLSGRPYAAAAAALGSGYDGVVFAFNEPAAVETLTRLLPRARVCLWVQNRLFRTYTHWQARRVVRLAHRVICCSSFARQDVISKAGEDAKIVTLLNGVDTDAFEPARPAAAAVEARALQTRLKVLLCGRIVPEKGIHVLLDACSRLKLYERVRVQIIGSHSLGPAVPLTNYERQLRASASTLPMPVEFIAAKPHGEMAKAYQQAEILAVPSDCDDACPLALLEGLASGLAVIASRRGGIPEAAGGSTLLFDSSQPAELAAGLDRLIDDVSLRRSLGKAARRRALELSWTSRYEALRKLL